MDFYPFYHCFAKFNSRKCLTTIIILRAFPIFQAAALRAGLILIILVFSKGLHLLRKKTIALGRWKLGSVWQSNLLKYQPLVSLEYKNIAQRGAYSEWVGWRWVSISPSAVSIHGREEQVRSPLLLEVMGIYSGAPNDSFRGISVRKA